MQLTITEHYLKDRNQAPTGEDRKRVWRMYAMGTLQTFSERTIGAPAYIWRAASGDDCLPVRFESYWKRIPDDDLRELWLALERARV